MLIGLLIGLILGASLTALAARTLLLRRWSRLKAAERRAQGAERMAEIGAMTGGLAHEIKNPLSTIGLNAQLLAEAVDDLPAEADQKTRLVNRVKALRRETDRLRGILSDFLEFAGQVRLERRPTNLNELVEELADFYTPEAARQGVRLRADLAPAPVVAHADPRLLKQAVLNLMINATQAMANAAAARSDAGGSGGGAGTGAVGGTGAGDLMLRVRPGVDDERRPIGVIDVIDTGPGIAPEVLPQIFKPYFTTKSGGTGLGLPTSRRLIEEHGGRIDVRSEPGRGTQVAVTVPLGPESDPRASGS